MGSGPRADFRRMGRTCLLLTLALLSAGCASMLVHPVSSHASPMSGTEASPMFPGRQVTPREMKAVERQDVLAAQLAFRQASAQVSDSLRRASSGFSRLRSHERGLGGHRVMTHSLDEGVRHLRWMDAECTAAMGLANAASEVNDPDMQLAVLRLAGARLESALLGSILLTVWLDVLQLADVALAQHFYSRERMFVDLWRWWASLSPALTALSSRDPASTEAVARDVPALVGYLAGELTTTLGLVHQGAERVAKALILREALEALVFLPALKLSLPSVPPSAPVVLGVGLSMGGDGVMMGTRLVVSAEWVEMMRRLVRAGVLSFPAVGALVRTQATLVRMTRAHDDLPSGVREALGDGPEVRALHLTDKAGAGMAEPPRHHVLPREFRAWFEKRGFTGEMDIDQFCVRLEQSHHQAIHGGGNWKLGRTWPGEWNRMIMEVLRETEADAGRLLTSHEILGTVAKRMTDYSIPMRFSPWRGP